MAGFDDAWSAVANSHDGDAVSSALEPLLRNVYLNLLSDPVNLLDLKASLEALLQFLTAEGRTNANCWAVDLFFGVSERWERDWGGQPLPPDFEDLLALMGQALHDTVRSPKIAENFDCLPEQLLDRARRLQVQTPLS